MARIPAQTPYKSEDGLTRAQGLWFQDCGLISQAEDTVFRVSGTILAVQSTVPGHALPPHTRGRGHGGRVSLRSSSGHCRAHRQFSRAVFCYGFFDPFPAPTTFPILASVLRMSHKYDAEAPRKRANWSISPRRTPPRSQPGMPCPSCPSRRLVAGHRFDRAPTRRRAEWILPASFYRICQSSFDHEIVAGTELSDASKVTCVKGRNFTAMPLELYAEDPADMCLGCVSDMKMLHDEAREELWDDLPRIFGLGDWENWRQ
ncbi:hypothetical protein B0H14DRAFT_3767805 [Mycena olivaceomarginata]|nr:hypothetical protein B0H14DRAFT_3767805 [Mycena olivaceomarginata]